MEFVVKIKTDTVIDCKPVARSYQLVEGSKEFTSLVLYQRCDVLYVFAYWWKKTFVYKDQYAISIYSDFRGLCEGFAVRRTGSTEIRSYPYFQQRK